MNKPLLVEKPRRGREMVTDDFGTPGTGRTTIMYEGYVGSQKYLVPDRELEVMKELVDYKLGKGPKDRYVRNYEYSRKPSSAKDSRFQRMQDKLHSDEEEENMEPLDDERIQTIRFKETTDSDPNVKEDPSTTKVESKDSEPNYDILDDSSPEDTNTEEEETEESSSKPSTESRKPSFSDPKESEDVEPNYDILDDSSPEDTNTEEEEPEESSSKPSTESREPFFSDPKESEDVEPHYDILDDSSPEDTNTEEEEPEASSSKPSTESREPFFSDPKESEDAEPNYDNLRDSNSEIVKTEREEPSEKSSSKPSTESRQPSYSEPYRDFQTIPSKDSHVSTTPKSSGYKKSLTNSELSSFNWLRHLFGIQPDTVYSSRFLLSGHIRHNMTPIFIFHEFDVNNCPFTLNYPDFSTRKSQDNANICVRGIYYQDSILEELEGKPKSLIIKPEKILIDNRSKIFEERFNELLRVGEAKVEIQGKFVRQTDGKCCTPFLAIDVLNRDYLSKDIKSHEVSKPPSAVYFTKLKEQNLFKQKSIQLAHFQKKQSDHGLEDAKIQTKFLEPERSRKSTTRKGCLQNYKNDNNLRSSRGSKQCKNFEGDKHPFNATNGKIHTYAKSHSNGNETETKTSSHNNYLTNHNFTNPGKRQDCSGLKNHHNIKPLAQIEVNTSNHSKRNSKKEEQMYRISNIIIKHPSQKSGSFNINRARKAKTDTQNDLNRNRTTRMKTPIDSPSHPCHQSSMDGSCVLEPNLMRQRTYSGSRQRRVCRKRSSMRDAGDIESSGTLGLVSALEYRCEVRKPRESKSIFQRISQMFS